ncbi:MAG: GldG family protein [Planctomycetes bacterium]|nr:GldG family protein [Planctomycetota bacterium]
MTSRNQTAAGPRCAAQSGAALAVTVHVLLLAVVLGQIVFLASRHRLRFDLTSDQMSTTSASTRTIVDKLDKRLVIEAYFSPKDKLPVNLRQSREVLENFLDELVQIGKGRVVVQRFDPNEDKAIADRCTRLQIQPLDLRSQSSTSLSVDRHWQGLRFVYGGGKQKVMSQMLPASWFAAEIQLTPAIKEVATQQKRKIGYMEWPIASGGQQQAGGTGWGALRSVDQIAKRFEFQNLKDEDGALLPNDLETLFLYRPKDLTDRQKYVLDQFLMRGGTMVVFADACEYAIAPNRMFNRVPVVLDAPGSSRKFVDQLACYGIDWKPKVLADMAAQAHTARDRLTQAFEYLALPQQTQFGLQMAAVPYPYFFHAMAVDWSQSADQLATRDGKLDKDLAAAYRKQFGPGIASDDFLWKAFQQVGRGPGFYWPTWVGLREKAPGAVDLPAGVTGRVMLRSSPAVLAEDPPPALDPIGRGDARARAQSVQKFQQKLAERFQSEPRQQAPLMVDVRGTFASFFAGAERPKRPSEIKEEEAKKAEAERQAKAAAEGEATEPKPADEQGPPPPDAKQPEGPKAAPEADPLAQAQAPGRILMIGDSDFLRDDLVRGDHRQAGGPYSTLGGAFFVALLDWLAEDRDLLELQSRVPVDRKLEFVDAEAVPTGDARLAEQALRRTTFWLVVANVAVPVVLLALFGFAVRLVRRAQKRSFHASLS